jgi:NAD(P)-dependent dehydrogenase (short-subunit alcohol dehydrogenase family)
MQGTLSGRVCIVTGPTSGIGKETAKGLARLGARVVLACRDEAKGTVLRNEMVANGGRPAVEVEKIDLADPVSIRAFAARFQETHNRLDVLINNAGILAFHRSTTPGGIESQFSVNVLGPFLLTNLLLPLLKTSAPSRIINVGSATHYSGRVAFDNLQGEREYRFIRAYSNSKLEILLLTYEFARRLEGSGVTANCVHPGGIRTGLYNGLPTAARFVKYFLRSPKFGAAPVVRLASAPELQAVSGRYFDRVREARSSPESYDTEVAARLWNVCDALAHASA